MKLILSLTPKNKVLTNDKRSLEYIHSFYTPEELKKFYEDLDECVVREWIKSYDDGSRPYIDLSKNAFVKVYIGDNVQAFIDYFIVERQNFAPIIDYFDAHPDEGTTEIIVE